MARRISLAVGLILIGLIAVFAAADPANNPGDPQRTPLLGKRVPLVEGEVIAGAGYAPGDSYNIDSARGRWVVVNFFATWCAGCVAEHPDLVELEEWGAGNGSLEVVSVVFNDEADSVAKFFADRGGSWPAIDAPSVAVEFRIKQIPESFLVDPSGVVRVHYIGSISAAEVRATIEASQ